MKAKTQKGIVNSLLVGSETDQMQSPESSSSLGSTTHSWASIFFPIKRDVHRGVDLNSES